MFQKKCIHQAAWLAVVAATLLSGTTALAQQLRHEARQAFGRWIDRETPSEYWIGVQFAPVPDALADQLKLDAHHGLLVADVMDESPAAAAGIKKHDVLLNAGETQLDDPDELVEAVEQAGKADAALKLELLRQGKPLSIEVKPQSRPSGMMSDRGRGGDELGRLRDFMGRNYVWPEDGPIIGFRPGMILPPGADLGSKLPENMSVEIHKEGAKPAEITVHRGDESWHVTQDELDKLPADVRRHVEPMLGWGFRVPQQMSSMFRGRTTPPGEAPREAERPRGPRGPGQPGEPRPDAGGDDSRFERLDRRIDQLQQGLERLEELLRRDRPRRGDVPGAGTEPGAASSAAEGQGTAAGHTDRTSL